MNDRLLARFDRAGILVWNEAPIWQRDRRAHLLWRPRERRRALVTVERTVKAARSHPSVLTHSVANELSFTPDAKPGTARYLPGPRPVLARDARSHDADLASTSRAGPATASSSPMSTSSCSG